VIVPNNEVQYGLECMRKANELIIKHQRNESVLKRYLEVGYL
jgi:hypothetical protein